MTKQEFDEIIFENRIPPVQDKVGRSIYIHLWLVYHKLRSEDIERALTNQDFASAYLGKLGFHARN